MNHDPDCLACPCRDHCVESNYCHTLSLILQRLPRIRIHLGMSVTIGPEFSGTVIAARIMENGNVFVKLRLDDPKGGTDRFGALAMKYGLPARLVHTTARILGAVKEVSTGQTGV